VTGPRDFEEIRLRLEELRAQVLSQGARLKALCDKVEAQQKAQHEPRERVVHKRKIAPPPR
jgi:hypothetical protein